VGLTHKGKKYPPKTAENVEYSSLKHLTNSGASKRAGGPEEKERTKGPFPGKKFPRRIPAGKKSP